MHALELIRVDHTPAQTLPSLTSIGITDENQHWHLGSALKNQLNTLATSTRC